MASIDTAFDYIIVGAGSAGCVLANRLSADPNISVCLIEAGPSDHSFPVKWLVDIPAGISGLISNPRYNSWPRARRHQRHQRHGLYPGSSLGFRSLGTGWGRRLEL
jgi:choline dehydrogenase-like flavoprotein